MKVITKSIIIALLCFYNSFAQNKTNLNQLIIGKWTMSETKEFKVEVKDKLIEIISLCNSCPEVTFDNSNIAKIIFPNGKIEHYSWKIQNNEILVLTENKNQDKDLTFDSEYLIKLKITKKFTELELIEKSKNYSYILRK